MTMNGLIMILHNLWLWHNDGTNYEDDMVMICWLMVTIWNESHDLSLWNENEWYDNDIAELLMIMTYYWMEWIIIYIDNEWYDLCLWYVDVDESYNSWLWWLWYDSKWNDLWNYMIMNDMTYDYD